MKKILTFALVLVFVVSAIIPMAAFADTAVVDFAVHPDLAALGCSVSGNTGEAKTAQYCAATYGRVTTAAAGDMNGLTITLEDFSGSTSGCAAMLYLSNNQYGWHNDTVNPGGYGIMFYPTIDYVALNPVSAAGAGPAERPIVSLGAPLGNKVTFTFNKNDDGSWKATVNDIVIDIAAADLAGLKDTQQVYLSVGSFNFFGYEESVTCKITACAFGGETNEEESNPHNIRPAEIPTAGTAGIDFVTHPDLEALDWVWVEGDAGDMQTVQATMGDPAVRVTTRKGGQLDGMTLVIENIEEMAKDSACYLYFTNRDYGWHNDIGKGGGFGIVFSPNWDSIELNPVGQNGVALFDPRETLVLGEKVGDSLAFQIKKVDDATWTININGTAFDVDSSYLVGIPDLENAYCSIGSFNFFGVQDVFLYDVTGFYFGDKPTTPGDDNEDEPTTPGGGNEDEPTKPGEDDKDEPTKPGDDNKDEPTTPGDDNKDESTTPDDDNEDVKSPETGVPMDLAGVIMAVLSSGVVGVTLTSRKKTRK